MHRIRSIETQRLLHAADEVRAEAIHRFNRAFDVGTPTGQALRWVSRHPGVASVAAGAVIGFVVLRALRETRKVRVR